MDIIDQKIIDGLYKISSENLKKESASAKIVIMMMVQIGAFSRDMRMKEYDRESARLYFKSKDFEKHCAVLGLDENIVRSMLTRDVKKKKKTN